jgi:predicted Zn-dependent protease
MSSVIADYFDGRASVRRSVRLSLDGKNLCLRGDGVDSCYPLDRVRVSDGIGSIRRRIKLPDGGVCEVTEPEFAASLERLQGRGGVAGLIHRWEMSWRLAVAALAITVAVVVLFMRFGVPVLARHVAFALPPAVESSMGRESLAALDHLVFTPSRISLSRRTELTGLFRRITADLPGTAGCRLEFRDSKPLGANALALPAGIVVITDGLVKMAKNDDELAAVMAHELGHEQGRHALRHVLQNSAVSLVMATLTGDILSVTSLSATLPTAMVNASFSRNFEREADSVAIAYLKRAGIPPKRYADILSRLQAELDVRQGKSSTAGSKVRNYLSTHPETGERIRRIMAH